MAIKTCLIILLFLFLPCVASATTYYVDADITDCADYNPTTESCGSGSYQAYDTITEAEAASSPSDTVIVKAGTYDETVTVDVSSLTLEVATGELVYVRKFIASADNIVIDGFLLTVSWAGSNDYRAFVTSGSDSGTIKNCSMSGAGGGTVGGIGFASSDVTTGWTIEDNTLNGCTYVNMFVQGNTHTITGNTIANSDYDAFQILAHTVTISGNTVYGLTMDGPGHPDVFQTYGLSGRASYDVVIEKNFIRQNSSQLMNIESDGRDDVRDWTIRNNLFIEVAEACKIYAPGVKFYNNLFYKCNSYNNNHVIFYLKDEPYTATGSDVTIASATKTVSVSSGTIGARAVTGRKIQFIGASTNTGIYTIASRDSDTQLTLTEAVSDEGPGQFDIRVAHPANSGDVRNNVFIGCGGTNDATLGYYSLNGDLSWGETPDYNYVGQDDYTSKAGFSETHGIDGGDPGLNNVQDSSTSAVDWKPSSESSILVDVGVTISTFSNDLNGYARPMGSAWDVGPYEFGRITFFGIGTDVNHSGAGTGPTYQ